MELVLPVPVLLPYPPQKDRPDKKIPGVPRIPGSRAA